MASREYYYIRVAKNSISGGMASGTIVGTLPSVLTTTAGCKFILSNRDGLERELNPTWLGTHFCESGIFTIEK